MSPSRKIALFGRAVLSSAVALVFIITTSGAASARPAGRAPYRNANPVAAAPQRNADTVPAQPLRGGPLVDVMTGLIRDCERLTAELRNFPADAIAQSVKLDDKQAEELKNSQNIAAQTAAGVAATCPASVPAEPLDRLDMIEREVGGIESAVNLLHPALVAFYRLLSDEQKARLVLRLADSKGMAMSSETIGRTRQIVNAQARRQSKTPGSGHGNGDSSPTAQGYWNCVHWEGALRAWFPDRVGQTISVVSRQRAAFYELAAAVQHAADTIGDSCPVGDSITPVARLEDLKKKLGAVRKLIATIRPALTAFSGELDDGQKTRFKDAI